ncbi:hypothetical protein BCON_0040g00230 [Botryotinia convoluta]|uniref:Uncharacterized protein n=1 Tax=Botryotinia convoluta TaxID=54673 RepID=A0A4Z1IL14_9HELO|nr:hypothetical protein BCON_0040g00230 [Botryotinia convoluta]
MDLSSSSGSGTYKPDAMFMMLRVAMMSVALKTGRKNRQNCCLIGYLSTRFRFLVFEMGLPFNFEAGDVFGPVGIHYSPKEHADAAELNEGIDVPKYESMSDDSVHDTIQDEFDNENTEDEEDDGGAVASNNSFTSQVSTPLSATSENVLSVKSDAPDDHDYLCHLLSLEAKSFPTLVNMLHRDTDLGKERRDLIAKVIKEKYRKLKDSPRHNAKGPSKSYPANARELKLLLYGPKPTANDTRIREEDLRPWKVLPEHKLVFDISSRDPHRDYIEPGLAIRVFDNASVSQCNDPKDGFNAGSSDKPLYTALARMTELMNHGYWPNRSPTPFVSVTTHINFAEELMKRFIKRSAKKGLVGENFPGQLVIINTFAQIAAGFPLLRIKDEMAHYKVDSRYGPQSTYGDKSFYENEWIAPYCVVNSGIVKNYYWRDIIRWIRKNETDIWGWYRQVAVPDFQAHEKARQDKILKNTGPNKRAAPGDFDNQSINLDSDPAAQIEQDTNPSSAEQRWVVYETASDAST